MGNLVGKQVGKNGAGQAGFSPFPTPPVGGWERETEPWEFPGGKFPSGKSSGKPTGKFGGKQEEGASDNRCTFCLMDGHRASHCPKRTVCGNCGLEQASLGCRCMERDAGVMLDRADWEVVWFMFGGCVALLGLALGAAKLAGSLSGVA